MAVKKSAFQRYIDIPLFYKLGSALIIGAIVGLIVGPPMAKIGWLGTLFINLLKMVVMPVVFFSLVVGVSRIPLKKLGKVGVETVIVYMLTSVIAIFIGLAIGNWINPGVGMEIGKAEMTVPSPPSPSQQVLNIIPTNPLASMAAGKVLPTIFFAIIFAIALIKLRDSKEETFKKAGDIIFSFCEGGAQIMYKIVRGVLEYGVIGVFALLATVFGLHGISVIAAFGKVTAAVYGAAGLHILIVYLIAITFLGLRKNPIRMLKGLRIPIVTAFSTRCGYATMPTVLEACENNLKIDRGVFGFTIPLGTTINMDGVGLYMGICSIFAANLVGVHLAFSQQMSIVLVGVLASIGAAAVPSAGLIMLTMVLTQAGLPIAAVAILAGIDPILDRARTVVNEMGDPVVTSLVAKWNHAIDLKSGVWAKR